MSGIDLVFPVYTMYHGTSYKSVATDIVQNGHWLVGSRDYVARGVYFGITRRTAENYAKANDTAIILCRVCLTPLRSSATLNKKQRNLIGFKEEDLGETVSMFCKTIEHWRGGGPDWFEYCIVQPNKLSQKVKTWRIRPLLVEKEGRPERIWGGMANWSGGLKGLIIGVCCWFFVFYLLN